MLSSAVHQVVLPGSLFEPLFLIFQLGMALRLENFRCAVHTESSALGKKHFAI